MLDPTKEYFFGQQEEVATLDPRKEYNFGDDPQRLYREAPPTLGETAMIIGLDIIPAIGGVILGGLKGPAGAIAGGSVGGGLGNYFSQKYRIARGLQDEIGVGELGASTALSGLPLGVPAKAGMATKTAIRAAQGSGLAGADLLARTTIDEDRLPTEEEVKQAILFGGMFGGGLGYAEAKWFSKTTGVDVDEGMNRLELTDRLTLAIDDAGGPRNFNATQKFPLGPRRRPRVVQQDELEGPLALENRRPPTRPGDDARELSQDEFEVIDLDNISSRDYAEEYISQIENKLLLETTETIEGLAKTQDVAPEFQDLKLALENKIATPQQFAQQDQTILNISRIDNPAKLWENLSMRNDSVFRTPDASESYLEGLAGKISPKWRLTEIAPDNPVDRKFALTKKDQPNDYISITETPGLILVNSLKAGNSASDAYQAILQYAFNKGKEYMPQYLTSINEMRTLGAMFSSALKNKSTKHFQPSEFQKGKDVMDLPDDYNWGENYLLDLEYLARGEANLVKTRMDRSATYSGKEPFLDQVGYDFTKNKFFRTTKDGKKIPMNPSAFVPLIKEVDPRFEKGVGMTTVQRAVVTKSLMDEKAAIHAGKHNIILENVLPAGVGAATFLSTLTDEEKSELSQAGGWGLGLATIAAALGVKNKNAVKAVQKGVQKGKSKNASDNAVRAKGGVPKADDTPRVSPNPDARDSTNPRHLRTQELLDLLEDSTDEQIITQVVATLAERASRDTPGGRRLAKTLTELLNNQRVSDIGTKLRLTDRARGILQSPDAMMQTSRETTIQTGLNNLKNKELISMYKAGNDGALEELRRRAYKNPRTKKLLEKHDLITGILTSGIGASVALEMILDEDEDMMRAGFDGGYLLAILAAATLGYKGAKKFYKTPRYKSMQAQARKNPRDAEPSFIKEENVRRTNKKNPFVPPGSAQKVWRDFVDITRDALSPLSRSLKGISPAITNAVRQHDRSVNQRSREFIDRGSPYLKSMAKLLKGRPQLEEKFENYLLNGQYNEITRDILDKVNAPQAVYKQQQEIRKVLDEVRTYARERGGIDVGYIEDYFPRVVADYKSFRKGLEASGDVASKSQIDKALQDYANKHHEGFVEKVTDSEAAEVMSRVLRGYPMQQGMTPDAAKARTIKFVDSEMAKGYKKPGDAFTEYVERMVQATERRNFFYRKPGSSAEVGFEGSRDRIGADLGSKMEIGEGISNVVSRLQKENSLSADDVDTLQKLLQARFSSQSVGPAFQAIKNSNYIFTMGNFGSAITQLGDLAYSFHFGGFSNTFKSFFDKQYDFVKHFGLENVNVDMMNSAGFTAKALDWVFWATQLKRLDKFAKNTLMNTIWRKQKQVASKDAEALVRELEPTFGPQAKVIVRELQQSNPNSKSIPKSVEELIWYKFLDLNPATLTEMPALYSQSGNARIAYMLKSFTLKQFDVFQQAGIDDIRKAKSLYSQGNEKAAAKLAMKGVGNLAGLAAIFAAANATTDVIKDTMYGRPTKPDELIQNNLLKLVGMNRYTLYGMKREGVGSAVLQYIAPPTTLFDRASRDLSSIFEGKEYKGNMLQGTPLDIYYWHYLGGLDKVKRME